MLDSSLIIRVIFGAQLSGCACAFAYLIDVRRSDFYRPAGVAFLFAGNEQLHSFADLQKVGVPKTPADQSRFRPSLSRAEEQNSEVGFVILWKRHSMYVCDARSHALIKLCRCQ
jgi:hypothetical protein